MLSCATCTGDWSKPTNTEDKQNPARLTVTIDPTAQTLEVQLAHAGQLRGPMKVTDKFYSANFDLKGAKIGAAPIANAVVGINRFTGEAFMYYQRPGAVAGEGLAAFTGECAPGKAKF